MKSSTISEAQFLNMLKNRLREMTRLLDTSPHVYYPDSLEAAQVQHEVAVLLAELHAHGLLPQKVPVSQQDTSHACEKGSSHVF